MKFQNVKPMEMHMALIMVNKRYNGNIAFNRFDVHRNSIEATLRVINSNKKNGTTEGRKLNQQFVITNKGIRANGSACWHVHGYFFEALLEIQPNAIITTQYSRIDINGGNWVDVQKGSIMNPVMYSELCECPLTYA
jgi:hypothetical protein